MKLIIIEAGDNLGKNTLIEGICRHINYDNICVRHFGKPPKNITGDACMLYQFKQFDKEFLHVYSTQNIFRDKDENYFDNVVIWNRSHLGEYVYSQMFRGMTKEAITDKLLKWEKMYITDAQDLEIYLVSLTADSHFFFGNEDGLSFSQTLSQKEKELQLFNEAHKLSLIPNKIMIKVDKNGTFRHKKDILNEVLTFTDLI